MYEAALVPVCSCSRRSIEDAKTDSRRPSRVLSSLVLEEVSPLPVTVLCAMAARLQADGVDTIFCPTCLNDDLSEILIFADTIETDRYCYDPIEDGVPVFAHGKSVHTDPGPVPPSAECTVCRTVWIPVAGTYELR